MMESVPSGSEEFSDLSRITLTEKYDSEWSIRINVFLDSAKPESQCGKIRLTNKDTKTATTETFSPDAPCDGIDCSFWDCDGWWHTPVTIDHGGLDLNDTVTLLVGEDSVRIELPKAFLIQYSPFFKAAFDPTGRFSEASSKEMCLPDEDPRDILTLIRFLIETPKDLKHLITPHWPFICYEEQDDNTYCCDTWHWRTDRIPLMVRFCAMVERLGFDFPEERIWPVLEASVGSPGQPTMPIATPIIEWAMDHALDGYFKRYVALLLSQIVRSGATSLDTYLPILEKHAVLAIGMLQATYARKEGTKYQWDESTQGWSGNRYLWRWQH